MPALVDWLRPWDAGDDPRGLPAAPVARHIVERARERASAEGIRGDWMINEAQSKRWAGKARPRQHCPTMTKSRCQGYYIGSRGRHATLLEAARLQGICAAGNRWPATEDAHGLLGNNMSCCVIQRVLIRLLRALFPACRGLPDPWELGTAQAALRADAVREGRASGRPGGGPPGGEAQPQGRGGRAAFDLTTGRTSVLALLRGRGDEQPGQVDRAGGGASDTAPAVELPDTH